MQAHHCANGIHRKVGRGGHRKQGNIRGELGTWTQRASCLAHGGGLGTGGHQQAGRMFDCGE